MGCDVQGRGHVGLVLVGGEPRGAGVSGWMGGFWIDEVLFEREGDGLDGGFVFGVFWMGLGT